MKYFYSFLLQYLKFINKRNEIQVQKEHILLFIKTLAVFTKTYTYKNIDITTQVSIFNPKN
jgi:hypothetical protein